MTDTQLGGHAHDAARARAARRSIIRSPTGCRSTWGPRRRRESPSAAYDKVKRKLGISDRHQGARPAVHDRGGRGRSAPAAARGRGSLGPVRRAEPGPPRSSEWTARRLFDGTEVAVPAGHADRRRRRRLTGSCCRRTARPRPFRMPKGGYYFDDMSFNRGDRIDPRKFRPISDIPDEHLKILSRLRPVALSRTPTMPSSAGDSASASSA